MARHESRHFCQVLGSPIGHSLSPTLHRAAYAELGLSDWAYEAVEVDEDGLAAHLTTLDQDCRGLSLTMPLKQSVVPLLDRVERIALDAGAVNTVVPWSLHGRRVLVGFNTDVPGAVAAVKERVSPTPRSAVVLGGGATAGSLVLALERLGCERVTVLARSEERARPVVDRSPIARWAPLEGEPVRADLVASTIPVEAQDDALLERVAQVPAVFEVVYDPWPSPLATAAVESGRTLVDGLDMLVHQAAYQVSLMTGVRRVPVEPMRIAGRAALEARG